jgi:FKBP-type peptidyl-prolyl cis-trans isomerase SlyD
MKVQPGKIVTLDYTLRLENGEEVESTVGRSPFEFIYGEGRIISGLEKEISGLKNGDKKTITVKPSEGYGERLTESVRTIRRKQFPEGMKLEVGSSYHTKDRQGQTIVFVISAIKGDVISIDFNHPLAGKTLVFDVSIVDVKDPLS